MPLRRPALHGNGPVLIEAPDFRRYRTEGSRRHLIERHWRGVLPREDVQTAQIGELGPLSHLHAYNNRNLLAAISQSSSRNAMKSRTDGIGNICVCDVRQICPVRIDVHHFSRTRLTPIVSNSGGDGDVAKDLLQLLGFRSETWQIFAGNSDLNRNSNRLARFESPRINDRSRNLPVEFRLQQGKQRCRIMIVFRSQNHLSIIGLSVLRCGAAPEARAAAAHKSRHRLQNILRMSVLRMASTILFRYSAGNGLHLLSNRAGRARRGVFGQPHVDVRKVLKVFWKELRLERGEYDATRYDQTERCCQADLPVLNGLLCRSKIPTREPPLPPFLDRSFALGFQQKRTDERHKSHRDEQSRQQRTTNDDRQTV